MTNIYQVQHFSKYKKRLADRLRAKRVRGLRKLNASATRCETRGLFDRENISKMKRGPYIVNIARGAIADREAVVEALESGQLAGYAGDVWDEQPAPKDHPWRTMPHHAMTPHVSGASLEGQKRYAEDTRLSLAAYFEGEPLERDHIIVSDGEIQSGSYTALYG